MVISLFHSVYHEPNMHIFVGFPGQIRVKALWIVSLAPRLLLLRNTQYIKQFLTLTTPYQVMFHVDITATTATWASLWHWN